MRTAKVAAAVSVALAVVTGLGWVTFSRLHRWGDGTVSWVDRPPPNPPEPIYGPPASAPASRADQLQGSVSFTGAVGMYFGRVSVTNIGSISCDIQGTPSLSGLRDGQPPEPIPLGRSEPGFVGLDPTRIRAIDLPPGGGALMRLIVPKFAVVNTGDPCSALNPDRPAPYDGLRVGLPAGGSVEISGSVDLIECLPGANMVAPGLLVHGYERPLAGPLGLLEVSIEAPPSVESGTTLDFVVVMRNNTAEPINLDPCPGYQARIDQGAWVVHHQLNCDDVQRIDPGLTVRFAMRLPVREGPRSTTLSWRFDTPGWRSISANIDVR